MNLNKTIHLLLIEDNDGDVDLVKILLKNASIKQELYVASTLFEGVNIIASRNIDIVLLDLSLPDSQGFKTLTAFREKCPSIPVIVLTGINNELIGNQAIKAGASDYLVKGQFDGKLLGRSLRYSLHRIKTQQEMKETADELEISKERFVKAQEMANLGSWEMDIVSSQMSWADEIFRIFEFTPNSIFPTLSDYLQYVHSEDKAKVKQFFENASKTGELHQLTHRLVVKGRKIKYVNVQAKMHFDELRDKLLVVGTLQDISQQKLTEQLIIEKNITSKASKIKDEALSDISFHIRTPLSSMINLLYLLDKSEKNPSQTELIDGLKISVDDLSIMVNNLLNFSVLVSDKIAVESETFVIGEFLKSMHQVLKIRTESAKIHLDFAIDDKLPKKIISDTKKITQILYNVSDYLIQKIPSTNTFSFSTSIQEKAGQATLDFLISSQSLKMTKAEIERLYDAEKFLEVYSVDEDEERNLLTGMAIVKKLVDTLEGEFFIDTKKDKGIIFNIQIPVEIAEQEVIAHNGIPTSPLNILLVEDHFLNQIATKKVLTSWSELVTVDIAENGRVGVDLHKKNNYNIILMDLQMPVLNGIDAAKEIRLQSNIPIIALTANASKQEKDKCLEVGINDYMSKPFKTEDLYNNILNTLIAHQAQ